MYMYFVSYIVLQFYLIVMNTMSPFHEYFQTYDLTLFNIKKSDLSDQFYSNILDSIFPSQRKASSVWKMKKLKPSEKHFVYMH